ncbi:MAG: molecular chaperone DnaJ [Nanoarchaeota archaeon]|nr:molecular chaperone DnaJ [Nanoarchaeota archaeon]
MTKDYYETLGVSKDSTKEQIKKAYKKLAMKYHPDKAPEEKKKSYEEKFKEINEAASVLGNEEKKSNYDRFGSSDNLNSGFSGFNSSNMRGSDFEDILSNLFGGGSGFFNQRRRGPRKGADLYSEIKITLEEASTGIKKEIQIKKEDVCDKCKGNGAESSSDISTCGDCHGSGVVTQMQRTPFGVFSTRITCRKCNGTGKVITKKCSKCHGKGKVSITKKLEVNIPAGIDNGLKLRLADEGEVGENNLRGDLYLNVIVKPHEIFQREGDDLYMEAPISFVEAALGTEISVKTIDGKAKLKIPAGTQSHTLFRMKNKGIKHINSYGQGDEFVKVILVTPKKISKKEKSLLKDLEKEGKKQNIFDKVRGHFFN